MATEKNPGKQSKKPTRLTSYILLKWIASREGLSMSEKTFLYAVAVHWSPNNSTYPGTDTIASAMGATERTAFNAKASLKQKALDGFEIVERKRRGSESYLSTQYIFDVAKILAWWYERYRDNGENNTSVTSQTPEDNSESLWGGESPSGSFEDISGGGENSSGGTEYFSGGTESLSGEEDSKKTHKNSTTPKGLIAKATPAEQATALRESESVHELASEPFDMREIEDVDEAIEIAEKICKGCKHCRLDFQCPGNLYHLVRLWQ